MGNCCCNKREEQHALNESHILTYQSIHIENSGNPTLLVHPHNKQHDQYENEVISEQSNELVEELEHMSKRKSISINNESNDVYNAFNLFGTAMNSPCKLAVYGYIRMMENNINFFCPIPRDVIEICCVYFYYLQNLHPLHKHSIIQFHKSMTNVSTCIDWEQVGQIMLDYRFLPSSRLINQALDHIEAFCHDEQICEKTFCDEICKAWSVLDDQGTTLWQLFRGNLHYTRKERERIYDLILHNYFRLEDMTTENLQFLLIKILRNFGEIENVNLIEMKQILLETEIDGYSFVEKINNAYAFSQLFQSMKNIDSLVWEDVYYKLTAWKLDTEIIPTFSRINSADDLMLQITECSDNDYENDEPTEWKGYRHNLKYVFQFFAGYKATEMSKKQLKKSLAILDMEKYWSEYLMDDISMDQFITYLCKSNVNSQTTDIKHHLETIVTAQWSFILKSVKCLEEIDNNKKRNGLLDIDDFQRFGEVMELDDLDTIMLFEKIDQDDSGTITMDQVYLWLQRKILKFL